MRTLTKNFETIPGTDVEIELPIGPTYGEEIELHVSPREGGGWHVGYLVTDDSGSTDDPINGDEGGEEYRWTYKDFRRGYTPGTGPEGRDEYLAELQAEGVDPARVFLVDVYEHGQCRHSLSGTGYQCPWDTTDGSGVLVALGSDIAEYTHDGKTYTLRDQAANLLDTYTQWCNGEVYDVVSFDVDETGAMIGDYECVGGMLGYDPPESAIYDNSMVARPT